VMLCSIVVVYQHFSLKMDAVWTPETLVFYYNTTWPHNLEELNLNIQYHENFKSFKKSVKFLSTEVIYLNM